MGFSQNFKINEFFTLQDHPRRQAIKGLGGTLLAIYLASIARRRLFYVVGGLARRKNSGADVAVTNFKLRNASVLARV
ncbi:MAG: hypothetical protein R3C60_11345 [Parvularculaceae bacterium]